MQKKLTMGIMSAFVASAITACSKPETPVYAVSSIDQCLSMTGDLEKCQHQWNEAQLLHKEVAPRFDSIGACQESFGDDCNMTRVQNSDGSFSDVFVPVMAGMMIGNIMANNSLAASGKTTYHTRTQPLYQEKEKRGGIYVPSSHLSTSTGTSVKKGASYVPTKTASSVSKFSSSLSRGGFGMSARGSSAS